MPQYCSNCNLNYNEGRYCRRCGQLLVETNNPQQQEQSTPTVKVPSKLPPAIIIFHAVAYLAMMYNLASASGNWEEILNIPMWAGLVVVSLLFLFISQSSIVYRLILLFMALLLPYLLIGLAPVYKPCFAPVVEYVKDIQRNRERASYEAMRKAHLEHFRTVFKEPQKVINVNYSYVILENGLCLKPYPSGHTAEIQDYLKARLIGQYIKVVVIDSSGEYIPSMSSGATTDFKKGTDKQYGDIPAYIYLGDELINVAIAKMVYPNSAESYFSSIKNDARKMEK